MILFSVHGSAWVNNAIAEVLGHLHASGADSIVAAWDERAYASFRDRGHRNVINMIDLYRKCDYPSPSTAEVREILKFDWEYGRAPEGVTPQYENHMINRCRQAHGSVRYLLKMIQPSLMVIWNNLSFSGKLFDRLANQYAKRLFIERGPIPGTLQMSRHGINADLRISGERTQSDWSIYAKNSAKKLIEEYRSKKHFAWPKHAATTSKIPEEVLNCEKPIALWASQVAYDTQIVHHSDFGHEYHKVYDILRESWNKDDSPYQLVIKLHPCQHFMWAHEKAKQIDGAIVTVCADIRDWLELPNLHRVAAVNSSVGFEAMLYGLPVVTLGRNWYTRLTEVKPESLKDFLNTPPPSHRSMDPWPPAVQLFTQGLDDGEFVQASDASDIARRIECHSRKERIDVNNLCDALEGR